MSGTLMIFCETSPLFQLKVPVDAGVIHWLVADTVGGGILHGHAAQAAADAVDDKGEGTGAFGGAEVGGGQGQITLVVGIDEPEDGV